MLSLVKFAGYAEICSFLSNPPVGNHENNSITGFPFPSLVT